jgi:hypothetical protein
MEEIQLRGVQILWDISSECTRSFPVFTGYCGSAVYSVTRQEGHKLMVREGRALKRLFLAMREDKIKNRGTLKLIIFTY